MSDCGLKAQIWVIPNFIFQHESSFMKLYHREHRKSQIRTFPTRWWTYQVGRSSKARTCLPQALDLFEDTLRLWLPKPVVYKVMTWMWSLEPRRQAERTTHTPYPLTYMWTSWPVHPHTHTHKHTHTHTQTYTHTHNPVNILVTFLWL